MLQFGAEYACLSPSGAVARLELVREAASVQSVLPELGLAGFRVHAGFVFTSQSGQVCILPRPAVLWPWESHAGLVHATGVLGLPLLPAKMGCLGERRWRMNARAWSAACDALACDSRQLARELGLSKTYRRFTSARAWALCERELVALAQKLGHDRHDG